MIDLTYMSTAEANWGPKRRAGLKTPAENHGDMNCKTVDIEPSVQASKRKK